jgi:hypothetical protein
VSSDSIDPSLAPSNSPVTIATTFSSDTFPYFAKFATGPPTDNISINWVSDLELMHHFTTSTYLTMPRGPELSRIWQHVVPKMAFDYIFLLHQVLATSAFHLAHVSPARDSRQKYHLLATHHQSHAIEGLRVALANITVENCHALFVTSSLLFVGALAGSTVGVYESSSEADDRGPKMDDMLDVFALVRGMNGILDSSRHLLRQGELGELFRIGPGGERSELVETVMSELQQMVSSIEDTDPTKSLISSEVASLRSWIEFGYATSTTPELRITMTWPISMQEEFLLLLKQRNQAALTTLTYYCVIMNAAEKSAWFMRGWGKCLMRDITNMLEDPWTKYAEWALGRIT